MKAPEKLYLHPTAKGKVAASWLTFPLTNEDIEYTRTDAFIEKVCEWLFDQAHNYTDVDIDYKGAVYSKPHTDKMIEDFRKAMDIYGTEK